MARMRQPATAAAHVAPAAVPRPVLAGQAPPLVLLEREVEEQFRPQMREALQRKIDALGDGSSSEAPVCLQCGRSMHCHDRRAVGWLTRFGGLKTRAVRYRCRRCKQHCRPLLDQLGVEPGRISGSLARLLAVLGVVVPYEMAARLALLFWGVEVSAMGVWRVVQRLGEAAERYSSELSAYYADSRSDAEPVRQAPEAVVVAPDGCFLGMQVRAHRRHRTGTETLPPLTPDRSR